MLVDININYGPLPQVQDIMFSKCARNFGLHLLLCHNLCMVLFSGLLQKIRVIERSWHAVGSSEVEMKSILLWHVFWPSKLSWHLESPRNCHFLLKSFILSGTASLSRTLTPSLISARQSGINTSAWLGGVQTIWDDSLKHQMCRTNTSHEV